MAVGDAPLRVPQNGEVHVIIGGTHRGASPTQPQEIRKTINTNESAKILYDKISALIYCHSIVLGGFDEIS